MNLRRLTWRSTGVIAGALLILLVPLLIPTTVATPAAPVDPVSVFLVDQGATASLVLPRSDGGLVRYAYGDWQYYALANNHALRGLAAVAWPTQGALGRGELHGPATADAIRPQVGAIEALHEIRVSRESVGRLLARLDAVYERHRATEVDNAPYGMQFVQHPSRYTYFSNSNHLVAEWLRELGCGTHGPAFYSRWRVEQRF